MRARKIVGLLFSNIPKGLFKSEIEKVLQSGGPALPPPQVPPYICLMKNSNTMRWFMAYGNNELIAKNAAMQSCKKESGHLAFHCADWTSKCEKTAVPADKYACVSKNSVTQEDFMQTGGTVFEAQAKAIVACTSSGEAYAVHCTTPERMDCK